MSWLAAVGTLIALFALIIGWLSWRRSGEALRETRLAPVRAAQHALLPTVKENARDSRRLLENGANLEVQSETLDPDALQEISTALRSHAERISDQTIADPPLEEAVGAFAVEMFGDSTSEDFGLIRALDEYVMLAKDTTEAAQRPGDASGPRAELLKLGVRRGELQAPLRSRIARALDALAGIDRRIREVEREGFGVLRGRS